MPNLRAVKLPFSREDILLWQSQYIFYSDCSISSLSSRYIFPCGSCRGLFLAHQCLYVAAKDANALGVVSSLGDDDVGMPFCRLDELFVHGL